MSDNRIPPDQVGRDGIDDADTTTVARWDFDRDQPLPESQWRR